MRRIIQRLMVLVMIVIVGWMVASTRLSIGSAETLLNTTLSFVSEGNDTIFLPILETDPPPPDTIALEIYNSQPIDSCGITDIANAGDERLFVATLDGTIRIIENDGFVRPTPYLDIRDRINSVCDSSEYNWESGLLGITFHPNYENNGYMYIAYTRQFTYEIVIARYTVADDNPHVANPSSREFILTIDKPYDPRIDDLSPVHSGGDLNFGSDGYLYIGFGDGGPDPTNDPNDPYNGDPYNNGQRLDTLLGKIIRIDVDLVSDTESDCGDTDMYTIPDDNPYVDSEIDSCAEIWSRGWRNPWRFSIDPETGAMWIGDVGEWLREEIDYEPAGQPDHNYGWHCYEGTIDVTEQNGECEPDAVFTEPIFEYGPGADGGCSVIGGVVYRGAAYPGLVGQYVFTDFCRRGRPSGAFWRISAENPTDGATLVQVDDPDVGNGLFSTIGTGYDGEIYVGTYDPQQNNLLNVYHLTVPDN